MKTKPLHVVYLTRNLRSDLHERLRLLASLKSISIEQAMNEVLDAGLAVLEQRIVQESVDELQTVNHAKATDPYRHFKGYERLPENDRD